MISRREEWSGVELIALVVWVLLSEGYQAEKYEVYRLLRNYETIPSITGSRNIEIPIILIWRFGLNEGD